MPTESQPPISHYKKSVNSVIKIYNIGSARVLGYAVYKGFLNRVYGILSLNTGIRYISFFGFQV